MCLAADGLRTNQEHCASVRDKLTIEPLSSVDSQSPGHKVTVASPPIIAA